MSPNYSVVTTKLAPPRLHKHTLDRPRVTQRLLEAVDYRLTILQAGAGYGKSTALAALNQGDHHLVWYHLNEEDGDPLLFLHYLLQGLSQRLGPFSNLPLALLEEWEQNGRISSWAPVVDALVNELDRQEDKPVLLVLDDAHHLNEAAETLRILDWLIGRAPATLHLLFSSRHPFNLPGLIKWRVQGQVLEIGQDELAFNREEIEILFRQQYQLSLTSNQLDDLAARTEGWAIALQLVRQRLQRAAGLPFAQALGQLAGSTSDLFTYLAQEVLEQLPPDVGAFLRITSVLRHMNAEICDCLRDAGDSEQMLRYLSENGLFVVELETGHTRYHHLFGELLAQQLSPPMAREVHRKAAACYQSFGQPQEAIYHLLSAGEYAETASILDQIGSEMVRSGRLDQLSGWIGSLPPQILEENPSLLVYLGDIARLHSRFDEAIAWYQQAEKRSLALGDRVLTGQALRGQARVYLDTVNPSQAERLLQEALRISDRQEDRQSRMRLLDLLAENLLNRGRSEEAQQYQAQAQLLRDQGLNEAELSTRVLLRTGRLAQARQILEEQVAVERQQPVLRPRAHRETLLILSLIYSFQGEREEAYRTAVEGTERGQLLDSPFVTGVGYMRQGHAWLLQKNQAGYGAAARSFQEAVGLADTIDVPRLKVEAYWGLCQAYGFGGDLNLAEQAAHDGIALAQQAGDVWVEACIRTSMGAAYALAARYDEAAVWLKQSTSAFRDCGDTNGESAGRTWQCLVWLQTGDDARLRRDVDSLLQLVRQHGYDYLFQRKTLFGPPDPRSLVPVLLFARDNERQAAFASRLLSQMGMAKLQIHPGYRLEVRMLGAFRLWRGSAEVPSSEWRRKKARQLFQLLLTARGSMLHRDRITELLWPDLAPEEAQRDFKIAYSALLQVLEPQRRRNAPSAYVTRDRALYGLRAEADLWLDADEFSRLVDAGDQLAEKDSLAAIDLYQRALALYHGEYLQEYPYDDWSSEERERLLTLYMRTAERLAAAHMDLDAWESAIEVSQLILTRDNCWEQAYRTMMLAYDRLGNRAQSIRTYQRCAACLKEQLGVMPTPATTLLYHRICQLP